MIKIQNILELDLINNLDNGLEKIQNNFLQTTIGSVVDNAINVGLRALLPDFLENQVIEIKDSILQNGIKETIEDAISSAISFGKSVMGIATGDFENVSQIQEAIKKGGTIDVISTILDKAIDLAEENGVIDKSIAKVINSGKKTVLKNISNNIDASLTSQVKAVEKLDNFCSKWKTAYENQDLGEMTKIYKNIKKQLEQTVPLENTINAAREIENLQLLITNNGGDFNLNLEEVELAKIL